MRRLAVLAAAGLVLAGSSSPSARDPLLQLPVPALALGAKAVMIGRAYLWGMAAGGERGVMNVIEILRSGVSETLLGLGKASVHDITIDDIIVPDGFAIDRKH
jgi:hypothetical protein